VAGRTARTGPARAAVGSVTCVPAMLTTVGMGMIASTSSFRGEVVRVVRMYRLRLAHVAAVKIRPEVSTVQLATHQFRCCAVRLHRIKMGHRHAFKVVVGGFVLTQVEVKLVTPQVHLVPLVELILDDWALRCVVNHSVLSPVSRSDDKHDGDDADEEEDEEDGQQDSVEDTQPLGDDPTLGYNRVDNEVYSDRAAVHNLTVGM